MLWHKWASRCSADIDRISDWTRRLLKKYRLLKNIFCVLRKVWFVLSKVILLFTVIFIAIFPQSLVLLINSFVSKKRTKFYTRHFQVSHQFSCVMKGYLHMASWFAVHLECKTKKNDVRYFRRIKISGWCHWCDFWWLFGLPVAVVDGVRSGIAQITPTEKSNG